MNAARKFEFRLDKMLDLYEIQEGLDASEILKLRHEESVQETHLADIRTAQKELARMAREGRNSRMAAGENIMYQRFLEKTQRTGSEVQSSLKDLGHRIDKNRADLAKRIDRRKKIQDIRVRRLGAFRRAQERRRNVETAEESVRQKRFSCGPRTWACFQE